MIEEFGIDAEEEAERRHQSAKADGLEITAAILEEIRDFIVVISELDLDEPN